MVIYCKSVHFGGFSSPGTPEQAFYEMVSFSENRALRLLQESGEPALPAVLQPKLPEATRLNWAESHPKCLLTDPHSLQEIALSATM